jgi:hypothetical protein
MSDLELAALDTGDLSAHYGEISAEACSPSLARPGIFKAA